MIRQALSSIEDGLTEIASAIGPWIAPLPTAWLVANSTAEHLGWPGWVAFVAGAVIELFGLSATGQALSLYEYNKTKRKSDPSAPVGLALALVSGYFMVATTLTVFLDIVPNLSVYAPGIFPLLSLSGLSVLALRLDHQQRLLAIESDKQERRERRSTVSSVAPVSAPVESSLPVVTSRYPCAMCTDWSTDDQRVYAGHMSAHAREQRKATAGTNGNGYKKEMESII